MHSLATYKPFLIVSEQNRINKSIRLAGKNKLTGKTGLYDGIIKQTTKYS